ncbi:MAG: ribonuclease H-like domain-containing protein [Spirochaetaceae bacterium]|jgi:uncharacterized protein YprB with RNaseH-like and TPR domain|nr:ribonuclease H-like domain-containing protein [Spirochaetaceae bacterium]
MNLKDRLRLIKTTGSKPEAKPPEPKPDAESTPLSASSAPSPSPRSAQDEPPAARTHAFSDWRIEGDFVRSRTVMLPAVTPDAATGTPGPQAPPLESAASLAGLCALLPDIGRFLDAGNTLEPAGLTFFDLETTGLSGGAGTVAFLAAFGTIAQDGAAGWRAGNKAALTVTQYLLLDYSGEPLFLQKCLEHLSGLVVTYNGKSFDSQIIKNRCIVNGLRPPWYHHADLVHPARYLWKRKLPSCRQRDIEERVLGLDRGDDLPGSFAPDAWFQFLKSGETGNLLKICAHNAADIAGLAAIWQMFTVLAASPLAACRYNADLEHLALRFHNFVKRRHHEGRPASLSMEETAVKLLEQAAAHGGEIAQLLWKRRYGAQLPAINPPAGR